MFDRSVLVTGCDSGIGLSLCRALPEKGYFVIAGCKTAEGKQAVDSLFSSLKENRQESQDSAECVGVPGSNARPAPSPGISAMLDVCSDESVRELAEQYRSQNEAGLVPDLYAVVNNAGIWRFSTLEESVLNAANTRAELERWRCVIDTNLMGPVRVTLSFMPFLKRWKGAKRARVVFVTSVLGEFGVPGQSAYVSSKFALRGFHEALLHELLRSGIHSTCIAPGAMRDTKLFDFDLGDFEVDGTYRLERTLRLKNGLRRLKALSPSCRRAVKTIVKAVDSKRPRRHYRNTAGTLIFKLASLFPKWAYIRLVDLTMMNLDRLFARVKPLNKLASLLTN